MSERNSAAPEKIKRPGLINQLLPYLITAAIFIWLYKMIDFRKMLTILAGADLIWFVPPMVLMTVVFALADSFTFGNAYSWFNAKLTNFEKIECRTAPYVVQVFFSPLAEVLFVLYLWRRKKVPPSQAISSTIWTVVNDFASVATALTIAVIFNLRTNLVPEIGIAWLAVLIFFWAGYFGNLIFWHSPLNPAMSAWIERSREAGKDEQGGKRLVLRAAGEAVQLLRTFSLARWRHYLWVYGVRIVLLVVGLGSNYAALKAVGVEVSPALAVIAIPIIFYGHFLPINVAGYGGPQALAILFFFNIGHRGTMEQVAAYSFLWSTGFTVGRFLFGMIFIRGFMKNTFPEGFANWRKSA